jgi:hypothetical protein
LLAYELYKHNKTFYVFNSEKHVASIVAAGIINPITGRNFVKSWMIDRLLPKAIGTYDELSKFLNIQTYQKLNILRKLENIKDENAWYARIQDADYDEYIEEKCNDDVLDDCIFKGNSYGEIKNSYQVKLGEIVYAFREYLISKDLYENYEVLENDVIDDACGIKIFNKSFKKGAIFCNGYIAYNMESLDAIPWNPTKGNCMIIQSKMNLTKNLREEMFVTPIGNDRYWVGSEYQMNQVNPEVDLQKQTNMENMLTKLMKQPFFIEKKEAGIRPSLRNRRPFMGFHPYKKNIILFNGLGTKGASLGPYFAAHLVDHLVEGKALMDEVNIAQYFK